eukprot:gene27194-biopygen17735
MAPLRIRTGVQCCW